jgi:hypothetical protein
VLNNHSNSLKSHGGKGPLRRVAEDVRPEPREETSSISAKIRIDSFGAEG